MSARRLSIEITMTLQSFGGPAGGWAEAAGAADGAALADAAGATSAGIADDVEGAGSTCGADATAGGASLEQALTVIEATAAMARAMQLRTRELVTSTLPDGKCFPRDGGYDSTVICSFSRSSK